LTQLIAIGAVAVYSFAATWLLLKVTNLVSPIRVSHEDEDSGLDLTQHGEVGYAI
jgi:Amt family ammonium transporter